MKSEVIINISMAIHSKSIALFRHCLGIVLILNGLYLLTLENLRIISQHRIEIPRKSRHWPLNLFNLGGESWDYICLVDVQAHCWFPFFYIYANPVFFLTIQGKHFYRFYLF